VNAFLPFEGVGRAQRTDLKMDLHPTVTSREVY